MASLINKKEKSITTNVLNEPFKETFRLLSKQVKINVKKKKKAHLNQYTVISADNKRMSYMSITSN